MKKWLFGVLMMISLTVSAVDGVRNVAEYNLDNMLALSGLDPVSFFPEGGQTVTAGQDVLALIYEEVLYKFSTEENRDLFERDQTKFEPTYGGWCAWGMSNGMKVPVDPSIHTVNGNRLHVFSTNRAKRNFDRGLQDNERKADQKWLDISGESPRF